MTDEAPRSGSASESEGVRVVPVAFGMPARQALAALAAEAKSGDPLRPVTVVVPSNYTGLALRRAFALGVTDEGDEAPDGTARAAGGGIAALDTLTFGALADRLAGPSLQAAGRRPHGAMVLTAAVREALRHDAALFGPVADHHRTAEALAGTYSELRDLSARQLKQVAATSTRAAAVVAICERIRSLLAPEWYDTSELLQAAAAHAESARPGALAFDPGEFVLYLPRRLSVPEARLVRALGLWTLAARRAPLHVLVGVTGDHAADASARAVCERLGVGLPAHEAMPPTGTRIMSVTDPDEEARTVVRAVLADLDDGVAPGRTAVFHAADEPYGRMLEEQFEAAGVLTYGSTARTLGESIYGRFALGLSALADDGGGTPFLGRREVFDLLAGAKIPRRQPRQRIADEHFFVPDSAWERLARAAHVVSGDDWEVRLSAHAELLEDQARPRAHGEASADAQVAWLRRQASECRAAAEFAAELRDHVQQGRQHRTWRSLCDWMRASLRRYLGAVGRDGWTQDWPPWERSAAERVEGVLDRLADLGTVERRVTLGVMRRALEVELGQPHGRSGTEGTGVYVGHVNGAIDIVVDRTYVVGLAEGIFPSRPVPDSLINEDERRALGGALALQTDATAEQHRALLAAMAGARHACTLLLPRGDLRRNCEYVPSRLLTDTARRLERDACRGDAAANPVGRSESGQEYFADGLVDGDSLSAAALDSAVDGIVEAPSYLAGIRSAGFPATVTEYDAASLLAHRASGNPVASHALWRDPALRRGASLIDARASSEFTRFDGNLAHVIDADGALAKVMSATRLEHWATCPRRYLFEDLLGIEAVEEPEDILRLSPLERGHLMHEAIDRFLHPLIANRQSAGRGAPVAHSGPGRMPPGPQRPPSDEDRDELVAIGRELADQREAQGLTGSPLLWQRDRAAILSDLAEMLERDGDKHRPPRGEIEGSEFRFGFADSAAGAVAFDLADGRTVRFRGVIDRVERMEDGALVVIDYKTGSPRSYRGLTPATAPRTAEPDPTLRGTKLQLPVYALAAAEHFRGAATVGAADHAAYWFISSRPGYWTWIDLAVDDEVMRRFAQVVEVIVAGIRGGVFPGYARPGDDRLSFVACPYCDPDGISSGDVRDDWMRKRHQPLLEGFSRLAELDEHDALGAAAEAAPDAASPRGRCVGGPR